MDDRIAFAFVVIGFTLEVNRAIAGFGVVEPKGTFIFGALEEINPESMPPEEVAVLATLTPAEAACAPAVVVDNVVGVPTVGVDGGGVPPEGGGVPPEGGGVVEPPPPPLLQAEIKSASERTSIARTTI